MTESIYGRIFNTIYEDDKVTYGDPANTEFKTETDKVPAWQETLRKHANNVEPTPKEAGNTSKKRRIEDVDGASDDE